MESQTGIVRRLYCKFKYAFVGIKYGVSKDPSIMLQVFISIVVIITGFILRFNDTEWLFVSSAIVVVLVSEFINSAIENMCDLLVKRYDLQVKNIKDVAAGAVLIAALYALVVAIIIIKGRWI